MPVTVEAQIGTVLKPLMNANGFSSVKLIGYGNSKSRLVVCVVGN